MTTDGFTIRQATMADAPEIWRIRYAVTENTLTPGYITDDDVREAIEVTGRGWVSEVGGAMTGFAIGNARTGNIWALFIDPPWQGQGHGAQLHDVMVEWLFAQGLEMLWLNTGTETMARRFYEARGWQDRGVSSPCEHRYELRRNESKRRIRLGLLRGKVSIDPDFDAPLSDDIFAGPEG